MAATDTTREAAIGSRGWAALAGAAALTVMAGGALLAAREKTASAAASVTTPAADPDGPWRAALRLEAGRLVVPVEVDGVDSLRFILDTAAESSAITAEVAERLGPDASRVHRMRVLGAGGARIMTSLSLRTLALGGATVHGVRAIVIDGRMLDANGRYDGLLGNDVLRRYDVVIDAPGGVLRLYEPGSAAAAGALLPVSLPMKPGREGFVSFDATIGGSPVHAILDSGTPVSLLNWRAAALAGISRETRGLRERPGGTAGIDGVSTATHEHRLEGVSFGGAPFQALTLRIADLPLFRVAGAASSPAMLVGVDLLGRCPLLLSYSTLTVYACARPYD
jgi:predicted aspartyl protease